MQFKKHNLSIQVNLTLHPLTIVYFDDERSPQTTGLKIQTFPYIIILSQNLS
jgi:hypothetical protein